MSLPPIHKLLEPYLNKYLTGEDGAVETAKKIKGVIEEQSQHQSSQIAFSSLMTKLVICALDLLNYTDPKDLVRHKIAGLLVFDCLLDVNDEITPERRIEIANHICKVLENDKIPFSANELILRTAALSIGHFGRIASTNEIEFLQNFCFPLALKLLADSRSESRRFAGAIILTQLAQNTPALIFAKRKTLFNIIWDVVSDRNPLVRLSAAETLESGLQLISQREPIAEYISMALKQMNAGFVSNVTEKAIGGLIILDIVVRGTVMSAPELQAVMKTQGVQFQEVIWKVFQRKDSRDSEIRQKVVEIIPGLASAFTNTFVQPNSNTNPYNFLGYAIRHLTDVINGKKERHFAYIALGKLFVVMHNHLRSSSHVNDIYNTVCAGFKDPFCVQALQCLGMIVNVSPASRKLVDVVLIDLMFRGGLTVQLIDNLKVVIRHVPSIRHHAQIQLRTHILSVLNRYTVLIDEQRGRPASARYARHGVPQMLTSPLGASAIQARSSMWNSGPASLFSALKSENLVNINPSTGNAAKPEDELIFALQVLSSPDFFPKQQSRERSTGISSSSSSDDFQNIQLLSIVRDGVVRYLDDFSSEIRHAAAQTCAAVLDTIVLTIDPNLNEFNQLYQILDRLLIMGVGDDSEDIRIRIFNSLTPSLDHIVALTENVHCLIEALNDESLRVRSAAMTVISRVAHYDSLHVMPVVRLAMKRLILTLNDAKDLVVKQESVLLLQALVQGSDVLIVPYVKQVMGPLMSLLNDPCADVVVAALSTIGELAVASPESVREHLDSLTLRLIDALNDQSSVSKQETAVIAMGQLVSSLTMVTDEPYKKYSGLFEGLIRAIQSTEGTSTELRLQAIKTLGLLGTVDIQIYHKRFANYSGLVNTFTGQTDAAEEKSEEDEEEAPKGKEGGDKALSKIERYYFSVVMRELMNVLRDASLASHHQTAINIAVKTIRILGSQTPQLKVLMDGVTFRLYQADSGSNLKETLLDHLVTVIQIIGRSMRVHLKLLVKIIVDFFDTHLQQCLDIVEALCNCFSTPDINSIFRAVLPTFLRVIELETSFDEAQFSAELQADIFDGSGGSSAQKGNIPSSKTVVAGAGSDRGRRASTVISLAPSFAKTSKILQKLVNLSDVLGEHRRELIPFVIRILDNAEVSVEVRRDALCTVMQFATEPQLLQEFASRIIHPLLRLVATTEPLMQSATLTALSCLVCRLGTGYVPYIIPVRRKTHSLPLRENGLKLARLEEYESLVNRLLKQRPLPPEPTDVSDIVIKFDDRIRLRGNTAKGVTEGPFSIGMQSLETAWALAGRNNASDLVEWMRRLSIELIRQSPSPVIRSCWTLAKTYRPIAEELFNSSLHSIWDELFSAQLNDVVDNNQLINGIEMALQSPQIPSNINVALLNLAEFMEMQDKRLPIDVRLLAVQAQSANMFAKCLRYREMEFGSKNMLPSKECVDALITVNNQLGLADRAVGVLQFLKSNHPHIEIQPLWLEKLFRWDDARRSYDEQITSFREQFPRQFAPHNESWMTSELGKLRCLHALGEYEELEECAKQLKNQIKVTEESEAAADSSSWAEVQRLGAHAAWKLGKWSSMDEFLEGEVRGNETRDIQLENNVSFYRTVQAIHDQDFAKASALIADTRRVLSSGISSLLSESYSRGYRAMVTMQVLAEMEEVVDYKQAVAKAANDLEASKNNSAANETSLSFRSQDSFRGDDNKRRNSASTVDLAAKKQNLLRKWRGRLKWAPKEIDVYRQILGVHTLVAEPTEDLDSWLELVTLCRKEHMHSLCENLLRQLGSPLPLKKSRPESGSVGNSQSNSAMKEQQSGSMGGGHVNDRVMFSTFKYWWSVGEKAKALAELTSFLSVCALPSSLSNQSNGSKVYSNKDATMFRVRCLLKRADWMRELSGGNVTDILAILMEARELASDHYSVWHAWAVANYDQLKRADTKDGKTNTPNISNSVVSFATPSGATTGVHTQITPIQQHGMATPGSTRAGKFNYHTPRKLSSSSGSASLLNLLSIQQVDAVTQYVVEAIKGFVRSINLGQGQPVANVLQDTLRLITLWFSYGTKRGVFNILESELEKISPENWLSVTPQLIARIHIKSPEISGLLRKLLIKVAVAHPQALVCPISVALNTNDSQQRMVATEVLHEMRKLRSQLVEEATMVSRELMRVAITPHELWYDGLEQAAQLYMDSKDIPSMLAVLRDLHDAMATDNGSAPTSGPELESGSQKQEQGFSEGIGKIGSLTLRDVSFRHSYSKVLLEAQEWIDQFRRTGRTTDLHQAWEVYQQVFKRIKSQIATLKKLELHHVSPALTNANNLSLAVPGTYKPSSTDICIMGFSPAIDVIASKQRPRKMNMLGSDGHQYPFLLKGHEDLRQDERVMQLFGLINVCLDNDRMTSNRSLNIVRYSVLPLSNNSGVIGWVQNCDTINQLVKQYRETKDIRLLLEVKLLQSKSLNYDKLPLAHKVEVFRQVLEETTGQDLAKMLWLNSKTSDVWVERRANFTKSLAVMSMVGYILGLGDRHPSNLMLDRVSGRVVHIDFGDCFEITSQRSKYPEIIPFRLTRMLTNCMETSGTEGAYRLTCERVMRVLRDNRDSVMAMLEAFVYDPLISWRLLANTNNNEGAGVVPLSRSNSMDAEGVERQKSPVDKLREQMSASPIPSSLNEPGDQDQASSPLGMPGAASVREVPLRRAMSADLSNSNSEDEPLQENLNARALEVINRIQAKLTGRDFLKGQQDGEEGDLTVEQQVHRLVREATSVENLCQLFTGWCPLW